MKAAATPVRAMRRLQYAGVIAFFAFIATPMLVIVAFSFDANRFPTIPWGGFSLAWHRAALADAMVTDAFANTAWVALGTAVLSTLLGFAAAYVDHRWRFRGQALFNLLVTISPAVPATVLGMAMLAFLSRVGLFGELGSIVLCHVAIATSFAAAIIRLRLREMGAELEPAAWNLGASPFTTLRCIVVPFCARSLAAAFFLSAAVSFDEYMIAWFVGGVHETVPVRLLNLLQGQVNPKINAIGTVVLLVSVSLVLIAQRLVGLRTGRRADPSAS